MKRCIFVEKQFEDMVMVVIMVMVMIMMMMVTMMVMMMLVAVDDCYEGTDKDTLRVYV